MQICPECGNETEENILRKKKYICPVCKAYLRVTAMNRIAMVADADSFDEWDKEITGRLERQDDAYAERIAAAREQTGLKEAVVTGTIRILGKKTAIGVCDASFLMGSMGYGAGEKVTRLFERAAEERLSVFLFCCSGGARIQEGLVSLMQMEKTAAAAGRHSKEGLLYCSILTDPTMGGVTASYAMLGDVILAEPGARIGFAGKRVIRQTIKDELPEGFQSAEFLESHGFVDGIIRREKLRQIMVFLMFTSQGYAGGITGSDKASSYPFRNVKRNMVRFLRGSSCAWELVREIRSSDYPESLEYIHRIFDIFVEQKGDRYYGDDPSVAGGIALLEGRAVTVLSVVRGKTMEESVDRNFGMPMPEGYRKARRLMKQAEKFKRPVITFINTPGAFCGVGAEERGQAEAVAKNLLEMSRLGVPVLVIITGEAGSGGALALSAGNEVWMLETATYSVLTPEGYASILWRDAARAREAAEMMKMTAADLKKAGIIDRIIPVSAKRAKDGVTEVSAYLKCEIVRYLDRMSVKNADQIIEERYRRFRNM